MDRLLKVINLFLSAIIFYFILMLFDNNHAFDKSAKKQIISCNQILIKQTNKTMTHMKSLSKINQNLQEFNF